MSENTRHMLYLAPKDEEFELAKMRYQNISDLELTVLVLTASFIFILCFYHCSFRCNFSLGYSIDTLNRYGVFHSSRDLPFYNSLVTVGFDFAIMLIDLYRRPLNYYRSFHVIFIIPSGILFHYEILSSIDILTVMCFMYIGNFVLTRFTDRPILITIILTCIYKVSCVVYYFKATGTLVVIFSMITSCLISIGTTYLATLYT